MDKKKQTFKRKSQLIHERDQMWASLRDIESGINETNNLLEHCINTNQLTIIMPLIDAKIAQSCISAVLSEILLYKIDSDLQQWID